MRIWIALGITLIILWAVLWLVFRIVAGVIHVLVFVGLLLLLYGLLRRGTRQVRDRIGSRGSPGPGEPLR
jgi:hypothetical protein